MEHNGRAIEVYRNRAVPLLVTIDVMQKEGDCPKKYTIDERLKCPLDCQNTFLTFGYEVIQGKIILEGALLNKNVWHYNIDEMVSLGYKPKEQKFEEFIKENFADAELRKNDGNESLFLKGKQICFKPICRFEVLENLLTNDPEIRAYQDLIRNFPKEVMRKGGIEFHGPNDCIITYKFKENVRD
jgi:hypothetical protein